MKKILLILLCTFLLVGCGSNKNAETGNDSVLSKIVPDKNEEQIKENVGTFFSLVQNGEYEKSQEYLDKEFDYIENSSLSIENEEVLTKILSKYNVEIISVDLDENNAAVKLSISHPSVDQMIEAQRGAISLGMEENAMSKAVEELVDSDKLEMETTDAYLSLKKKQNNWEILTDGAFLTTLYYGTSGEVTTDTITDNEKKVAETQDYIDNNIELTDYLVSECEGYSGKTPGLSKVSVKNNGNRDITSLSLQLDFLSDSGDVVNTKKITVIGYMDSPIKAGYSWKMEDDKFFEIESLPDDVNIEKVKVSIATAELEEAKSSEQTTSLSEEETYLKNNIELLDSKVSICEGYDGEHPGLSNVSVKNNGDKDISELTVTVYFQDEDGKDIAENYFLVIGGLFGGDTLKANYSWKMEDGKFYEIENLADEVDINRNRVEITEITFE